MWVVSACCPISKVKGEVELELGVGKKVLVFVLVVQGYEWSVTRGCGLFSLSVDVTVCLLFGI